MADFNRLVNEVINRADIILLVIDARRVKESINREIEGKLKQKHKKFIYVINKCDLITREEQAKINLPNSMQISAIKHLSTMRLLKKIMEIAHGKEVVVGVVGFPNTGKSTIINSLKGRHSASTSPSSGHTRALQMVRINKKIMMIDTPGVFSYMERNADLVVIGAIDAHKIREPDIAAGRLIQTLDGKIEKFFGVDKGEDCLEVLDEIAVKKNVLKKGGEPDSERMGKMIIDMWQKGRIK